MNEDEMTSTADEQLSLAELLQEAFDDITSTVDAITDTEIEARLHQLLDGPDPAAEIARDLVSDVMDACDDGASLTWTVHTALTPAASGRQEMAAAARLAEVERARWEANVARIRAELRRTEAEQDLARVQAYLDQMLERAATIEADAQAAADALLREARNQAAREMQHARQLVEDAHQLAGVIIANAEQAVPLTAQSP